MVHPLDGVQAKLDRAYEHGAVLSEQVRALPKGEFYDTYQVTRPKLGKGGIMWIDGYVRVLREPPLKLGIIAGDCAHNLRGCLDLLIYQLALLDTRGRAPDGTSFPIARTEREYIGPRRDGPCLRDLALAGIRDDHRAFVDAEQPYVGRSRYLADRHPLAVLSAFSNADKHRVASATHLLPLEVKVIPIGGTFTPIIQPDTHRRLISNSAHIYALGISEPSGPEVRMQVDFVFSLAFGKHGLTDADLLNTCGHVRSLVDRFRPLFA